MKTSAAAKTADKAVVDLSDLANDFLDLWQANLLAWATDPILSPTLPPAPAASQKSEKVPKP